MRRGLTRVVESAGSGARPPFPHRSTSERTLLHITCAPRSARPLPRVARLSAPLLRREDDKTTSDPARVPALVLRDETSLVGLFAPIPNGSSARRFVAMPRGHAAATLWWGSAMPPRRALHATPPRDSMIVIGSLSVAGVALALQYGLRAAEQYRAARAAEEAANPTPPDPPAAGTAGADEQAQHKSSSQEQQQQQQQQQAAPEWTWEDAQKQAEELYARATNISFDSLKESAYARNFYQGGFEDKMSRREAALTLGVRESSDLARIKEAHRRLLRANHPDIGGSSYIASKVNEAKELLLKGR